MTGLAKADPMASYRPALPIAFALTLAGCATGAGKQLEEMEATVDTATASYDACVAALAATPEAAVASQVITLAGADLDAAAAIDMTPVSEGQMDAVVAYVLGEYGCFAEAAPMVAGIDSVSLDALTRDYARAVREGEAVARGNTSGAPRNAVENYFTVIRDARDEQMLAEYEATYSALAREDARIKQRRADALGSLGSSMQAMDAATPLPSATPAFPATRSCSLLSRGTVGSPLCTYQCSTGQITVSPGPNRVCPNSL